LLGRAGYIFVERNFRARSGELDLIFVCGECLIGVEVKTRLTSASADYLLFESISQEQESALPIRLQEFARSRLGKRWRGPMQVDYFGIILDRRTLRPLHTRHLEGMWAMNRPP